MTEIGTDWCFELAEQLSSATAVGDLIIMATPGFHDLVVLEGHARLAAMFVGELQARLSVSAYVGVSASINQWQLF
jgi:hypothetical protein